MTKIAEQLRLFEDIYVAMRRKRSILIFLDPDMIVVSSLRDLQKQSPSFDIAVTVRDYTKMPINAGFLAISWRAQYFMIEEVFSEMLSVSRNLNTVFADQIALHSVFKCKDFKISHKITIANQLKALCLPATLFNASPADVHTKVTRRTKVIHFEGDRKQNQSRVLSLLLNKSPQAALGYAMRV